MGRGGRTGSKCGGTSHQHARAKSMDSEDSDEDYVAEVDEVDDQSDELDSLVGEALEEESCFEAEEEEKENGGWRRVVKPRAKKGPTRRRKNGIKKPKKRKRVVKFDDEEESDDDDEEFMPEVEFLEEEEEFIEDEDEDDEEEEEEEEFLMLKANTRKRGRSTLKARNSVKSQRGSTKAVRKPHTKKRTKTSSLRRRVKSDGDEDFNENCPTRRGRNLRKPKNLRKPVRRNKRVTTTGSDSDFCPESSDYEFTISEEEREQIREANRICGSLGPNLRSSRRIQEDEVFYEPKKIPASKGKEKAEEKKHDVGKPVCGICLTEEGKNTVRGTLNCCSHYFCFACIFEWSKVETRCPLCKQRFISISKPGRCGKAFDLRDTVIPVPERDQVYQPSEEELRDFLNPYENVICTECDQGGDDALMLLCDLCDSPAHTYCVGLGREVPEGNWYCDGCRPAAHGSSHSQTHDPTLDQRISTGISDGSSTYENMAEIDLNVTIPETPVSQGNGFLTSPRFSGGSLQAPSPASGTGVSTVSGRRLIHLQIRNILTSRLGQMTPGSDINAFGNLIGRGVNSTQQHSRITDIGPSYHSPFVDSLQERHSNSVQNRDSFPGSLGYMARQMSQPSTSANGTSHSQVNWSGVDRLNLGGGESQILAGELHPCTGRTSIGPEIGAPPSLNRYEEHGNLVKQQVHSMVRSQLKSLTREMNLGHTDYVEISRRSAHTIMAACGLEPQRHDIYETQPPICLHVESRLANVETSPINGCCLSCFEGFVKDVVKRITDIVLQSHWNNCE